MVRNRTGHRLLRDLIVLGVFVISATGCLDWLIGPEGPVIEGNAPRAEGTAQARQGGPAKGPPSSAGEDMPSLQGGDSGEGRADAPPGPAQEAPPPPEDEPEPEAEEEQTTTNFAGSWHSAGTCDASDAPYRWEITLSQQPGSDQVSGTISFHDCPGGGRASYDVSGRATTENYVVLDGTKTSGRGDLNGVTPASQSFRITKGGEPFPNFAP